MQKGPFSGGLFCFGVRSFFCDSFIELKPLFWFECSGYISITLLVASPFKV